VIPPNSHLVKFVTNDGTPVNDQTVVAGGKVGPVSTTKDGYMLVGWYTEETFETEWDFDNDTVSAAIILYAKWETAATNPQTFTVTFNANGGTPEPQNQTITEGSNATEPDTPTKTGYDCIFEGWYDETLTTRFVFSASIIADITLYAKWRPYEDTSSDVIQIRYIDDPDIHTVTQFFEHAFADEGTTCHYLEAATTDMDATLNLVVGSIVWYGNVSGMDTYTATGIGMGRRNTALILTTWPLSPAAMACNDYTQGSKTDWFLPSKDELNLLYVNRNFVGNLDGHRYWSSSGIVTDGDVGAWIQNFQYNGLYDVDNFDDYSVRAIRAF